MHVQYLIIGNGVAGVNAARTLAEGKPDDQSSTPRKSPPLL